MGVYTYGHVMVANTSRKSLLTTIAEQLDASSGSGSRERAPSAKPDAASSQKRPARASTKLIAGHFDPEVSRQLRLIAAYEDTTIQALLGEAIDLLFALKGKPKIAELKRRGFA